MSFFIQKNVRHSSSYQGPNEADKKSVLIVAIAGAFLAPFMGSSINIALPVIAEEFQIDAILLSWVATAYLLSVSVFLVPFGRLADIIGRKKIFTYGIIIFTIASLLSALSTSITMLIIFRVFQGLGGAMIFGTRTAIITSVFPTGERGRALGITISAVYMGLILGPFIGGILTHNFGWRSIFLLILPIGVIVLYLIFKKLKGEEWADAKGEKFDWFGAILYSSALILLIYGASIMPKTLGIIVLLIGVVVTIVFFIIENKLQFPVLQIKLFKQSRVFLFSNIASLINYCATYAISFLLSLYLQYIKGFSPQEAGIILLAQPIMMAVVSPFVGRLSDKINPGIIASIGMAIISFGLVLLTFLSAKTNLYYIVPILIFIGTGFGFFSSPNANAIMGSVEKQFYGVSSAILATTRIIGQMLSMGIVMFIFSILIGRYKILSENYPQFLESVKIAFIVFAIFCFLGIFASLARNERDTNNQKPVGSY